MTTAPPAVGAKRELITTTSDTARDNDYYAATTMRVRNETFFRNNKVLPFSGRKKKKGSEILLPGEGAGSTYHTVNDEIVGTVPEFLQNGHEK